ELIDKQSLSATAVLVVADTLAEEVDDLPDDERSYRRQIHDVSVGSRPPRARSLGILHLLTNSKPDFTVDVVVAELCGVVVREGIRLKRLACDCRAEPGGGSWIVRTPRPEADLGLRARVEER